jgi:dihydroorotate dehydrogenase electron transfer subunit
MKLESKDVRTIFFEDESCREANPGQYVMIWVPNIDEIPLSLSIIDQNGLSGVTVKRIGQCTDALFKMMKSEVLGLRGPYGNWFELVKGKVLVVGGGIGIAALLPLIQALIAQDCTVTLILGGKTRNEIYFQKELSDVLIGNNHEFYVTTENGSLGQRGVSTDALELFLKKQEYKMIYTCGPEPMMRKVFDIAELYKIPLQACIERIIRCSIGLCGSCAIGKFRVCKKGLILSSQQLRHVKNEFGKFKRGFDGRRIYFNNTLK